MRELEMLEKDRIFCKHDYRHLDEVKRIMLILNTELKYDVEPDMIIAAALLHDIGRINEYKFNENHRTAGKRIIYEILKECDYLSAQIDDIYEAITKHNAGNNESNLQGLLYKADKLSRECYNCKARELCYWREELKNKEKFCENRQ